MRLPCPRETFSKSLFFKSLFSVLVLAMSIGIAQPTIASENEGAEDENFVGRSLGGNLREGPGLEFDAMQSVGEGTWLTIVRSSDVVMDDYDWFEIRLDDGTDGFMWGGILCSNGQLLAGVYEQCTN